MVVEFKNGSELETYNVKEKCQKFVNEVTDLITTLEEQKEQLREENVKMKNEFYATGEFLRLQAQLDEAQRQLKIGFPISEEEYDAIKAWQTKHNAEYHKGSKFASIGGRFTYIFIPTSIGITGDVKCSCGAEFCFRELK